MAGIIKVDRRADNRPWGLIVICLLAAAVGVLGLPLQYATYNLAGAASKKDIEANARVVAQLAELEARAAANVEEHRMATDEAHAEICRIIEGIAEMRDIIVPPCEFERLEFPRPSVAPIPTPSP